MKEYICKEDFQFPELELRVYNLIQLLPTVTEVDICRRFAENVVERYNTEEEYKKDYPIIMTKLLAEMENERV